MKPRLERRALLSRCSQITQYLHLGDGVFTNKVGHSAVGLVSSNRCTVIACRGTHKSTEDNLLWSAWVCLALSTTYKVHSSPTSQCGTSTLDVVLCNCIRVPLKRDPTLACA